MRSFEEQLQAAAQGLALLRRTRSKDDQRVMLGYLFKDLDALRAQVADIPPHLGERFAALEAKALEWRARLGAPLAPDENPEAPAAPRRRRKEKPHEPLARSARHPDPGDRAPETPVVPPE